MIKLNTFSVCLAHAQGAGQKIGDIGGIPTSLRIIESLNLILWMEWEAEMDCPSEERMMRMELEELPNIESLEFDLPGRTLEVCHTDSCER